MNLNADYRIAVRPDQDGYVDDVVVNDVSMFRMEDMGDSWWLCCYLAGTDESITFDIAKQRGRSRVIAKVVEWPELDGLVYEDGAGPGATS